MALVLPVDRPGYGTPDALTRSRISQVRGLASQQLPQALSLFARHLVRGSLLPLAIVGRCSHDLVLSPP